MTTYGSRQKQHMFKFFCLILTLAVFSIATFFQSSPVPPASTAETPTHETADQLPDGDETIKLTANGDKLTTRQFFAKGPIGLDAYPATSISEIVPAGGSESTNREELILEKLQGLVENDGVAVTDKKLLPASYVGSMTLLISMNSSGAMLGDDKNLTNFFVQKHLKNRTNIIKRQRAFELSPKLLLILALDVDRNVLWWHLQPNPHILRAEFADENGHLEGSTKFLGNVSVLFSLPNDASISEVYIYRPVWDGSYSLDLMGSVGLQSAKRGAK